MPTIKRAILPVVDPYDLPDAREVEVGSQVLVQFRNGRYGIGDVVQAFSPQGPGNVVLMYRSGRATRVEPFKNQ